MLCGGEVFDSITVLVSILVIIVIHSILKSLSEGLENKGIAQITYYVQYILIVTLIMTNFVQILDIVNESIQSLVGFMNSLIPILITLMITTGSIVSANLIQPIILFLITFIGNFIIGVILPFVLISTALGVISKISDRVQIDKLSKFFKTSVVWILGVVLTIFVGVVSVEGSLSSSVDGITAKTAKAAVSSFIPVVGKILGDAVDTVIGCSSILKNAIERKDGLGDYQIKIEESTLRKLASIANGDVRTALNGLEVATLTTPMEADGFIHLTDEVIQNSVQSRKAIFDKNGEEHYDNISAFIKSMRGSDPDAAVFYLARALNGGEDPMFLARRIVICASEDVGMANPNALVLANSAMQAIHMVGMPEARIILSQAAIYVATSKKSNASYLAINKALEDVATKDTGEIPMHIRNAPAKGMEEHGYGQGYKYPHDYPMHQVEQQYLPDKMLGTKYYIEDDTVKK